MNGQLETFLSNFSALAYCIALAFAALGCRRIRMAGGDKAFGIAALLGFACLAFSGVTYIFDWLIHFASPTAFSPQVFEQIDRGFNLVYLISSVLLLIFTAVFATGCFNSARRPPRKPA